MNETYAKEWFNQANHYRSVTNELIKLGYYDVACSTAYQSIEMLLKSVNIKENGTFSKIHKIDKLAKTLNVSKPIQDAVLNISKDYTKVIYPDVGGNAHYEVYNKTIAESRIKAANDVWNLLKTRYKPFEDE
jgi:HEPN domain-containing protein